MITKNFSLQEFEHSDTAIANKLNNKPPLDVINNIILLCENLLQPIRTKIGKKVSINSGYRSSKLNKLVGGSKTSQHMKGQAADIVVEGLTPKQVYDFILKNDFVFDQMILEPTWVHISFKNKGNRMQHWILL
jgi:zinc D-Ala-D-Ala carboxypeptidase